MSSPPIIFPPPSPSSSSSSPPHSYSSYSYNTSLLLIATLLAVTIAFTIIVQLILRLLAHLSLNSNPTSSIASVNSTINNSNLHVESNCKPIVDSLPIFTVSSLPRSTSAICTICLSQFASDEKHRLLPICHHAFHSTCIDAWLKSSPTCPLCRSLVQVSFPIATPEPQQQHQQQHDIPAIEATSRISWLKDYVDRLGLSSPSPLHSMRFPTSPFGSIWGSRRFDDGGSSEVSLELGEGGESFSSETTGSGGFLASSYKWIMGGAA